MFTKHGYLTNILSSLRLIAPTTGYVHQGNDMGDEWNHSDDELAFFTYWPLVRFAFTGELRAKYLTVVREHLEIEGRNAIPIWNFIAAACGAREFDAAGSVWTLRGTPLDTIAWRVTNSHRQDLTKLPPNFHGTANLGNCCHPANGSSRASTPSLSSSTRATTRRTSPATNSSWATGWAATSARSALRECLTTRVLTLCSTS